MLEPVGSTSTAAPEGPVPSVGASSINRKNSDHIVFGKRRVSTTSSSTVTATQTHLQRLLLVWEELAYHAINRKGVGLSCYHCRMWSKLWCEQKSGEERVCEVGNASPLAPSGDASGARGRGDLFLRPGFKPLTFARSSKQEPKPKESQDWNSGRRARSYHGTNQRVRRAMNTHRTPPVHAGGGDGGIKSSAAYNAAGLGDLGSF